MHDAPLFSPLSKVPLLMNMCTRNCALQNLWNYCMSLFSTCLSSVVNLLPIDLVGDCPPHLYLWPEGDDSSVQILWHDIPGSSPTKMLIPPKQYSPNGPRMLSKLSSNPDQRVYRNRRKAQYLAVSQEMDSIVHLLGVMIMFKTFFNIYLDYIIICFTVLCCGKNYTYLASLST